MNPKELLVHIELALPMALAPEMCGRFWCGVRLDSGKREELGM
jgi:hypothetical protein